MLAAVLASASMPDLVRAETFRAAVRDWCRAEAVAELAYGWLCEQEPEFMFGLKPGVARSPAEVWRSLSAHAGRMRARLGLDPASYAQVRRDLGLADKAAEDRLVVMAREGAEIVKRRAGAIEAAGLTSHDDDAAGASDSGDVA